MKKILFILSLAFILPACATLPASPQPGEATAPGAYPLPTDNALVPESTQEPSPLGESELIPLLLAVNQARVESANVIAELMEAKKDPAVTAGDGETGKRLIARLEENRKPVESTYKEIAARPFVNQEAANQYGRIEDFYQQLILFENYVIDNLAQIENEQEFSVVIDRIFEADRVWPDLMAADENFRELLTDLASRHKLEFEDKSYDEIFRDRLAELRAPAGPEVSDRLGQLTYEFEVPNPFRQTTVSAAWTGAPIELFQFALQHPDGSRINFKLAPLDEDQYIFDIPISNLPTDGSVVTLPSEEYPALDNAASSGMGVFVGYDEDVVMLKLLPEDPFLAPMYGKWSFTITAPAGLEIVLGDATIP